jgi:hypothetical protein
LADAAQKGRAPRWLSIIMPSSNLACFALLNAFAVGQLRLTLRAVPQFSKRVVVAHTDKVFGCFKPANTTI